MAAAGRIGRGTAADLTWSDVAVDADVLARHRRGPWDRVADRAGWDQDTPTYRSPPQIRSHWAAEWRRRTGYGDAGDRDNVILITARQGKGEGKSALAQDIADLVGSPIAPAELAGHVTFRARQFLDIINSLGRGEVGIYDDAGEGLLNTEFWSEESRVLTKAIAIARDVHATLVLCIPSVAMFSGTFMRALVDYWIQVQSRGTARVHPKPGERYTKSRGLGWYPDREWNPLTWPRPEAARWRVYSRFRRESRVAELERFKQTLEKDPVGHRAGGPSSCPSCGQSFSRADALHRHQTTSCPGRPGARR